MDNFIRTHEAIQVVCAAILPSIKKTLIQWHVLLQKTLGCCTSPSTCKTKGKPVVKKSCKSCVQWGQEIEAAYYPQTNTNSIPWSNIDPTTLGRNFIEVAKAYTLRLVQGHVYNDFGDFDAASLMMIMLHFEPFHQGDPLFPDKITKVCQIRNDLSHMKIDISMVLDDSTTSTYFDEVIDLVTAFHPHYLSQDQVYTLVKELKQIHSSPVSVRMKEDALRPFTSKVQEIHKRIAKLESRKWSDWQTRWLVLLGALSTVIAILYPFFANTSDWSDWQTRWWRWWVLLGALTTLIAVLYTFFANTSDQLDVTLCRRQLKRYYLQILCKIPRFPGDKQTIEMDRIYTNLSILRHVFDSSVPIKMHLNSHNEIFTTLDNGLLPHRILVLGQGGSGKSTLIAKCAYDWAQRADDSAVKDIPLMFALNMRHMTTETSLEEAILHQLLPKDTTITKESLSHYIKSNPSDVIILLDSYDEFSRGEKLSTCEEKLPDAEVPKMYILSILAYNLLTSCRVLVTSRHWRESDFSDYQSLYVKMEVEGFTTENIKNYIMTYFRGDEDNGAQLFSYIESHDLFSIASCPLMTQLLCLVWQHNKEETIPTKIGELYSAIFKIMYKHCRQKGVIRNSFTLKDMNDLTVRLGEVALDGLWPPKNTLNFPKQEVEDMTSNQYVEDGCKTGIISIEHNGQMTSFEQAMSQNPEEEQSVVFFHTTIQEKCAGEYLSDLATANPSELNAKLNQLNTPQTCLSVQMILMFACGKSKKVAELILQRLIVVSNLIRQDLVDFFDDKLIEPLEAKLAQDFVELCLLCNYESDSTGQFNSILLQLFASQKLHFLATANYTNIAIGYFLTWIKDKLAIDNIKLTELPGHGEKLGYGIANIKDTLSARINQEILKKPSAEVQNLVTEYINTNKEKIDLTLFIKYVEDGLYSYVLHCIQLSEYFSTWFSTNSERNIRPIIHAVKYISLCQLHLSNVNLSNSGQTLIETLEQGHLSLLTHLKLARTKLGAKQLTHLAAMLPQATPMLQVIDIGFNKVDGPVLQNLSKGLPKLSLEELWLNGMYAPAKDMAILAKRIPEFCSKLKVLRSHSNNMDDAAGLALVKALPHAHKLGDLSLNVDGISKEIHNDVIMSICNLTQVHRLHVGNSEYPEDLMLSMARVLPFLSNLKKLFLFASSTITASPQSVLSRASWKVFIASLKPRAKHMAYTLLQYIRLHEEDLEQFLDLSRETNLEVGFSRYMWPEGMDVPLDVKIEFF